MSDNNNYQSNIDKAFETFSNRLNKVKEDLNDYLNEWKQSSTDTIQTETVTPEIAEEDNQHSSQLASYYSLLSQFSASHEKPKRKREQKNKKSNQAQFQNDVEYVSTKYPLFIKRNEQNQLLLNEIKIESNEKEKTNNFEFTTMDDLCMTEAVLDIYKHDLIEIQKEIDDFKTNCNEFRNTNISSKNYEQKKSLIIEYIKCQNETDKNEWRKKLVRDFT